MNTPKIRFKGFKDDWEQRKLGDVTQEFKSGTSLKAEEIDIVGDYPVYGGNGLRGYTSRYNHDDEYALIGRQGALCGNMNYSVGKAYFTEHAVVVKADDNNDTMFLYYLLDTMNLGQYSDQSAQPGLAVNKLVKLENLFPTKVEQQRIGRYFSDLDHLITLHQRKCDETKQLKKFMLQKMFLKNGEKNPEIRFEGFTDDWEQRKFGELFSRRMERNLGQFDNTRWISVARMYFQDPDRVTSNNIDTRTYVMREGDIAFEGHSNQEYRYGRFVANDIGDGVISELFPIYRHIVPYDNNYWKYAIQIETIMAPKILRCIEISYTSSNKLDEKFFLEESTSLPGIEEQRKIGALLSNLDHLITLHQRKCEKLKELKKFMLQNMFV